jgi:alpha-glucoside transport system permease protein
VNTAEKLVQMVIAIALFFAVMSTVLALSQLARSRRTDTLQASAFLLAPIAMLAVGLLYPAGLTVYQSFHKVSGQELEFIGLANYREIFTNDGLQLILRNTALWVILTPVLATAVGLVYAILVDKSRYEKLAKALIFLPMAISLVGASIIWKFVYDYRATENDQIGVLNQVLKGVGLDTYKFLLNEPWNNIFLIVIMIWVQAGFAMTVLSAAIRAIPDDIIEAARLDGVNAWKQFRFITVPSIRPSLIVVLTTISITTLKVFDIVRTTTGGNFNTSVLANEFFTQSFRANNKGLGAALGTLLFVLVMPIVIYNVIQMRKVEAT